jgi:hypothetical protein
MPVHRKCRSQIEYPCVFVRFLLEGKMAKRRKFKLPFNRRKVSRQLKKVGGTIWGGVRFIWKQTLVYNVIFIALGILLFSILLSQAFKAYFNCDFLIHESLNVPSFFCSGKDFTVVKIPGLNSLMNGPLEFIRKGIIWVVLFLFVALSGYLTFIIINMKKVIRLIKFDRREWKELLSTMRVFITIFVLLTGLFFAAVMF